MAGHMLEWAAQFWFSRYIHLEKQFLGLLYIL